MIPPAQRAEIRRLYFGEHLEDRDDRRRAARPSRDGPQHD